MKFILIAISCLLMSSLVKAQHIVNNNIIGLEGSLPFAEYTDLSFVDIYLSPTYNSKNQIVSASLADMLKVTYEYNENNQVRSKTIYFFCSNWLNPYAFVPYYRTTYTYSSGKLVEEKTTLLQPEKLSYKLKGDSKNEVRVVHVKKIGHNPISKVDTITNLLFNTRNQSYDTTKVLVFRNTNNLTDSLLTIHKEYPRSEYSCLHYLTKCIPEYDSNSRVAKVHKYIRKPNERWKQLATVQYSYENNKFTCSLTRYENKIETEYNTKEFKARVMNYSISYDSKGRVIDQEVIIQDKNIIKATYQYNAQGNTSINSELNLSMLDRSLKEQLYPKLEDAKNLYIDELFSGEYTFTSQYSKSNRLATLKVKNNLSDKREYSHTYSSNDILSETNIKWYNKDGSLGGSSKVEYKYSSPNGREGEIIRSSRRNKFKLNSYGQCLYNERIIKKGDQWITEEKYINDYDENGFNILSEKYSYYDNKLNTASSYSHLYKRNNDNFILHETSKHWNKEKNDWNNAHNLNYTYDSNNKQNGQETYSWNDKDGKWEGSKKDSTSIKGNVTEQYRYSWLGDKSWVFTHRQIKTKYSTYSEEIMEKWEDNRWVPFEKRIFKQNSSYVSEFHVWDKERNEWKRGIRPFVTPSDKTPLF